MLESIQKQTLDVLTAIIAHVPHVVGGLLLVLAGWLLARFLRMVITRLIRALNHFLDRQFHGVVPHVGVAEAADQFIAPRGLGMEGFACMPGIQGGTLRR